MRILESKVFQTKNFYETAFSLFRHCGSLAFMNRFITKVSFVIIFKPRWCGNISYGERIRSFAHCTDCSSKARGPSIINRFGAMRGGLATESSGLLSSPDPPCITPNPRMMGSPHCVGQSISPTSEVPNSAMKLCVKE